MTLGMTEKNVWRQAKYFDPAYPDDPQFVENAMWTDKKVVFATFNMPGGSNNDLSQWTAPFTNDTAQTQERTARSAANIRWLQAAFNYAERSNAKAVVIVLQADMWDPAATIAQGGAGLDQYTAFVRELATLDESFPSARAADQRRHSPVPGRSSARNPISSTGLIHHMPPVTTCSASLCRVRQIPRPNGCG